MESYELLLWGLLISSFGVLFMLMVYARMLEKLKDRVSVIDGKVVGLHIVIGDKLEKMPEIHADAKCAKLYSQGLVDLLNRKLASEKKAKPNRRQR